MTWIPYNMQQKQKQNRASQWGLKNQNKKVMPKPKRQRAKARVALGGAQFNSQVQSLPAAVRITRQSQAIRLVNKEQMSALYVPSSNFLTFTRRLNPGNAITFPWGSKVGINYNRYRARSIRVRYIPRVPLTQTGSIYLAYEPNVLEVEPSSTQAMSAFKHSISGAVTAPLELRIPCDNQWRYVRAEFTKIAEDLKTYDIGSFTVAFEGTAPTPVVTGVVWIEYDFELDEATQASGVNNTRALLDVMQNPIFLPIAVGTFNLPFAQTRVRTSNLLGLVYPDVNHVNLHAANYAMHINTTFLTGVNPAEITLDVVDGSAAILRTRTINLGAFASGELIIDVDLFASEGDTISLEVTCNGALVTVPPSQLVVTIKPLL